MRLTKNGIPYKVDREQIAESARISEAVKANRLAGGTERITVDRRGNNPTVTLYRADEKWIWREHARIATTFGVLYYLPQLERGGIGGRRCWFAGFEQIIPNL